MSDLRRRLAALEGMRRAGDVPAAQRRVRARLMGKLRTAMQEIGHEWHPMTPGEVAILAADTPAQREADERTLAPYYDPTWTHEKFLARMEDVRRKCDAEDGELARAARILWPG